MNTISFLDTVIDDYSENAFETCKREIFPFFIYLRFTKIEDIRKSDFKEELYRFYTQKWYGQDISEYLGIALKYYMTSVFKYVPGKRAEKYMQRGCALADSIKKTPTENIDLLEDLAIVYFSLLREHLRNPEGYIEDLDLSVDLGDLDNIKKWSNTEIFGPETKGELHAEKQKLGQFQVNLPKMKSVLLPQSTNRKEKIYRVSCLMLCRLLDKAGMFIDGMEVSE